VQAVNIRGCGKEPFQGNGAQLVQVGGPHLLTPEDGLLTGMGLLELTSQHEIHGNDGGGRGE